MEELYNVLCLEECLKQMNEMNLLKEYNFPKEMTIVQGSEDNTAKLENTYKFKEQNKNCKITIIELKDAQHFMNAEQIGKVADMLLTTLQKQNDSSN